MNCTKILSDGDLNADVRKIAAPTLIVHGGDDQLAPIAGTALRSAKIICGAKLVVYEGAPHGLPSTHKTLLNADLLAFVRAATRS